MKKLSIAKLAEFVKTGRENYKLTQEGLSKETGINRIMIGRIEREDYIPSISQIESLAKVLNFDITKIFTEEQECNSFIALRSEVLNQTEKDGVEKLFSMMLSLRQQILIRGKFENEFNNKAK
jgi:transcriptional regulator with XRE-family HTH domain